MDRHLHFAANPQRQAREHIQRIDNSAVGAVLDRHDAVLGMPAIHFLEHRRDRIDRNQVGRPAEPVDGRQVREAERRTQVDHAQRLQPAPRTGDHLPKNRVQRRRRQRSGVQCVQTLPQVLFARVVEQGFVTRVSGGEEPRRQLGPLIEQLQQALVDRAELGLNALRSGRRLAGNGPFGLRLWLGFAADDLLRRLGLLGGALGLPSLGNARRLLDSLRCRSFRHLDVPALQARRAGFADLPGVAATRVAYQQGSASRNDPQPSRPCPQYFRGADGHATTALSASARYLATCVFKTDSCMQPGNRKTAGLPPDLDIAEQVIWRGWESLNPTGPITWNVVVTVEKLSVKRLGGSLIRGAWHSTRTCHFGVTCRARAI